MGSIAKHAVCALLLSCVVAPAHSANPVQATPEVGMFLVAGRALQDPFFQHSVVLLVYRGQDGSVGLVVNHITRVSVAEALPHLAARGDADRPLFLGGPVSMDSVGFLTSHAPPTAKALSVKPSIFFSADPDALKVLLEQSTSMQEMRVFAGHSSWQPRQLLGEIARGDWYLVEADAESIFATDPETLWLRLIDRLDPPGILVYSERGQATEFIGL